MLSQLCWRPGKTLEYSAKRALRRLPTIIPTRLYTRLSDKSSAKTNFRCTSLGKSKNRRIQTSNFGSSPFPLVDTKSASIRSLNQGPEQTLSSEIKRENPTFSDTSIIHDSAPKTWDNIVTNEKLKMFVENLQNQAFPNPKAAYIYFINLSPEARKEMTVYHYNLLLSLFRKNPNKEFRIPLLMQLSYIQSIIRAMDNSSVKPDTYSYNELLGVHANLLNLSQVRSIMSHLNTFGPHPDTAIYNNIIRIYSRSSGTIDEARYFWRELIQISKTSEYLKPDVLSFGAMISGEVVVNNWEKVRELLSSMQDFGLAADIYIRNTVLAGIASTFGIDAALQEVELILQDGLILDGASYAIIIKHALQAQRLDAVKVYMKRCVEENQELTVDFLSSLVIDVKDLVLFIEEAGAVVSTDLFAALIHRAIRRKDITAATNIFELFKKRKLGSNQKIYGVWFDVLSKEGRVKIMRQVFSEMTRENVKPDIMIFSSIFEGISRCYEPMSYRKNEIIYWNQVLKDNNLEKSSFFYNTTFTTYSIIGSPTYATKYTLYGMYDMLKTNVLEPNSRSFNLLFRAFSEAASSSKNNSYVFTELERAIKYLNFGISKENGQNIFGIQRYTQKIEEFISKLELASEPKKSETYRQIMSQEILKWYYIMRSYARVPADGHTYLYLITAFTGLGQPEHANMVFNQLVESASQSQSLIYFVFGKQEKVIPELMKMFLENRKLNNVLAVWRILVQYGLQIDSVSIAAMLKACDLRGHIETAIQNMNMLLQVDAAESSLNPVVDSRSSKGFLSEFTSMEVPESVWSSEITNKVMYLYIAILIKNKKFEKIMPALESWRMCNASLFDRVSLSGKKKSRKLAVDDPNDDDDDDSELSLSKKSYFLDSEMVKNIFIALQNPELELATQDESKSTYIKLASYIENHYPWAISV